MGKNRSGPFYFIESLMQIAATAAVIIGAPAATLPLTHSEIPVIIDARDVQKVLLPASLSKSNIFIISYSYLKRLAPCITSSNRSKNLEGLGPIVEIAGFTILHRHYYCNHHCIAV